MAKAYALFEEIEASGIKLDTIARAALMRSFNKGGQPGRVLSLAEITREKKFLSVIPYFLKWYLPVACKFRFSFFFLKSYALLFPCFAFHGLS